MSKLKDKQPTVLLTVLDLAYIMQHYHDEKEEDCDDSQANWTRDGADEEPGDEGDSFYLGNGDVPEVEGAMRESALWHGMSEHEATEEATYRISAYFRTDGGNDLDGIRSETCCNRSSGMLHSQYWSYFPKIRGKTVHRHRDAYNLTSHWWKESTDRCRSDQNMEISFTMLKIITDVYFLILKEDVITFVSMKNMVINKLHISIQRRYICFAGRRPRLAMENFFHIHRCDLNYLSYS